MIATGRPRVRHTPTRRAQLTVTDLANERHIALGVAELATSSNKAVPQRCGILGQPLPNIRFEPVERIRPGCYPACRGSAHPKGELVLSFGLFPDGGQ